MNKSWLAACAIFLSACSAALPAVAPALSEQDVLDLPGDAAGIAAADLPALQQRYALQAEPVATRLLGGLKPAIALAQADIQDCREAGAPGALVVSSGFPMGRAVCRIYLAQAGDEVFPLKTQSELRTRFAPIEDRQEALSYLLAMEPSLSNAGDGGATRVSENAEGYLVALYDAKCNEVSEILTRVSRQGDLMRVHTQRISSGGPTPACDG